jgi:hypothetical protein
MANYFKNPDDLHRWVLNQKASRNASNKLMRIINLNGGYGNDELNVTESCDAIFSQNGSAGAEALFQVLAKYNITTSKSDKMKKEAQSNSRQRNKWNRVVDGFNENTPWRVSRDKYYDFTHYYTDEIKFDDDPKNVYSGEAIWRTYVMDKFYRDYKDDEGHVVGGYINDRFYVFPDAGTPANPDVPRDGGNLMSLPNGVKTRKPNEDEYSTERRLEEARGNKLKSVEASRKFKKITTIASKNLKEAGEDKIFNIFKDTLDMREAGIDYKTILESVSDHYNTSILSVAQIDREAQRLAKKHDGIGYKPNYRVATRMEDAIRDDNQMNLQIMESIQGFDDTNLNVEIPKGSVVVNMPGSPNTFQVVDSQNGGIIGRKVSFNRLDFEVIPQEEIQNAADELGLNEGDSQYGSFHSVQNTQGTQSQGFNVTEMQ